jgi:hypothetical protein
MKKLLFIILSLVLMAGPVWGATYNIGPGQTYTTFTALVAAETLAGDDIVDGGGNAFTGTWLPNGSGTDGHPIIIRNATIESILPNGQTYIELQNLVITDGAQIGTNWTLKNCKIQYWRP